MEHTVIKILKKHLDKGIEAFNQENDMLSLITNYHILAEYPELGSLRELARELISTIKGMEYIKLITVPSAEELKPIIMANVFWGENYKFIQEQVEEIALGIVEWLEKRRPIRELPFSPEVRQQLLGENSPAG